MNKMIDGNTAALSAYEAEQDRRDRAADSYRDEAEAAVLENLLDEGFTEAEAAAFLLTDDGQDLVDAEIGSLELSSFDADIDAQIHMRKLKD